MATNEYNYCDWLSFRSSVLLSILNALQTKPRDLLIPWLTMCHWTASSAIQRDDFDAMIDCVMLVLSWTAAPSSESCAPARAATAAALRGHQPTTAAATGASQLRTVSATSRLAVRSTSSSAGHWINILCLWSCGEQTEQRYADTDIDKLCVVFALCIDLLTSPFLISKACNRFVYCRSSSRWVVSQPPSSR